MADEDIERGEVKQHTKASVQRMRDQISREWAAAGYDPKQHEQIVGTNGDRLVLDFLQQRETHWLGSLDIYDLRTAIRRRDITGDGRR